MKCYKIQKILLILYVFVKWKASKVLVTWFGNDKGRQQDEISRTKSRCGTNYPKKSTMYWRCEPNKLNVSAIGNVVVHWIRTTIFNSLIAWCYILSKHYLFNQRCCNWPLFERTDWNGAYNGMIISNLL